MRMQQGWTGLDGRYGMVDAVFNRLPANYFDALNWNTEIDTDSDDGQSDICQIEREIEWHEKNIARIEQQLTYAEGIVNRTYLEQQLIEERYAVKRLKNMLNYQH